MNKKIIRIITLILILPLNILANASTADKRGNLSRIPLSNLDKSIAFSDDLDNAFTQAFKEIVLKKFHKVISSDKNLITKVNMCQTLTAQKWNLFSSQQLGINQSFSISFFAGAAYSKNCWPHSYNGFSNIAAKYFNLTAYQISREMINNSKQLTTVLKENKVMSIQVIPNYSKDYSKIYSLRLQIFLPIYKENPGPPIFYASL